MIETRRTGRYHVTSAERPAIAEGVAQADRGDFIAEAVVSEADRRHGI